MPYYQWQKTTGIHQQSPSFQRLTALTSQAQNYAYIVNGI